MSDADVAMADEGDWQAISWLARKHPDPDVREVMESIWCGLVDVWMDGDAFASPEDGSPPGRGGA